MQVTKAKLGFQDAIGLASRDSNSVLIAQAVVDETTITLSGFGPEGRTHRSCRKRHCVWRWPGCVASYVTTTRYRPL